ncbi:hypothetical protein TRVL_09346 [Trypanosoma vivax]|nr:hypothetical protein TRVL_09346 [Trypanosoma vivax]
MPLVNFQLTLTTVHTSSVATFDLSIVSLAFRSTQAPLSTAEQFTDGNADLHRFVARQGGSDIPINERAHCFAKRSDLNSPRCRTDFIRNECGHAPPHTKQELSTSHRAGKLHGAPQHAVPLKWLSER